MRRARLELVDCRCLGECLFRPKSRLNVQTHFTLWRRDCRASSPKLFLGMACAPSQPWRYAKRMSHVNRRASLRGISRRVRARFHALAVGSPCCAFRNPVCSRKLGKSVSAAPARNPGCRWPPSVYIYIYSYIYIYNYRTAYIHVSICTHNNWHFICAWDL